VLARSVLCFCSDESEEPPGPADFVDLPVADIMFPSIPVLATALDVIPEDSEETIPLSATNTSEATIFEQDLENIVSPPVLLERDMGPVGADIPAVTQDDPDNDVDSGESFDDAAAVSDTINTTFGYLREMDGSPRDFVDILSHQGNTSLLLELELLWSNGQQTFAPFALVKKDQPTMAAKYVLKNKIPCDSNGSLARWAHATLCALQQAIKTIRCAYSLHSSPDTVFSDYVWRSLPPRA
jgi:hypothetical protein